VIFSYNIEMLFVTL